MYLAAVHAERHRRAMAQLASVRARAATVWPDLASAIASPSWSPPPGKRRKGGTPTAPAGGPLNVRPAQPNSELPQ
jgi:hypothetical protein